MTALHADPGQVCVQKVLVWLNVIVRNPAAVLQALQ